MDLAEYDVQEMSKELQSKKFGGLIFLFAVVGYVVNTALVAGTAAAAGGAIVYSYESGKNAACSCD